MRCFKKIRLRNDGRNRAKDRCRDSLCRLKGGIVERREGSNKTLETNWFYACFLILNSVEGFPWEDSRVDAFLLARGVSMSAIFHPLTCFGRSFYGVSSKGSSKQATTHTWVVMLLFFYPFVWVALQDSDNSLVERSRRTTGGRKKVEENRPRWTHLTKRHHFYPAI